MKSYIIMYSGIDCKRSERTSIYYSNYYWVLIQTRTHYTDATMYVYDSDTHIRTFMDLVLLDHMHCIQLPIYQYHSYNVSCFNWINSDCKYAGINSNRIKCNQNYRLMDNWNLINLYAAAHTRSIHTYANYQNGGYTRSSLNLLSFTNTYLYK